MCALSWTVKAAVCLTVAVAIAFPTSLSAHPPDNQTDKGTKNSPAPVAQSSLVKLAATVATSAPELQGDYIPCKFTVAELRALVSPEVASTLTPADEELLKGRVIAAATSNTHDGSLQTTGGLNGFIDLLAQDTLSGLTPAQALNRIIQDLATSRAAAIGKALSAIQPTDTTTIVDAARNSIAMLERPPDVGCAMSVLSWDETHLAYGRMIANTYVAVQVVVRNLNRDQAFVLHDVEFGVNADPTGRPGRFFSGRDKVVVRALSTAQSSFDPRNLFIHSAQGIGAVLSAAVPIFANLGLTDTTAVFNGAFVPGLDKYWKDLTIDQLNLLDDTGFSSQASSQTVVPISGTVMFVTFVPSKPFEEGWWTQRCVENTYLGTTDEHGLVRNLETGDYNPRSPSGASGVLQTDEGLIKHPEQSGVDVSRAIEICELPYDPLPRKHRNGKGDHSVAEVPNAPSSQNQSHHMPNVDLFRNAYSRPYRKWSPNSLAIFRELSNVVVSGTHIISDTELAASVSALSCSTDDVGNLAFPKPEKDTLSCPLSGKNLDKIAKLRLRNAKDAVDTTTTEGSVSVSGDSSNGTVSFQTAALHSLPQTAYSVFAVSSKGVEQKTSLTIHLSTDPYMSGAPPKAIDFSTAGATSQTLTISGNHLAAVDTVVLATSDGSKKVQVPLKVDALKTDTKLLVPLDPSTLTDFGTTKTTLTITLAVGTRNYETGQQFDFTGAAKASGAAKEKTKPAPPTNKASTPTPGGTSAH